jgi:enoyl-CoA hydratase
MVMTYENVLTEIENGTLIITVNRPDKLNALNNKTIEELHEALLEAENEKEIKCIIITGSG